MLNFLDKNAPDILRDFISHSKDIGIDCKLLFTADVRILAMYMFNYLAVNHRIDTYISKMGFISIRVTYPTDSNYNKEGTTIMRKAIDITNKADVKEYLTDLISYLIHNPY